jgi:amidophosphoribosyltransferase
MEQIKHNCGLFGVLGNPDASRQAYLGLYALQHRGQESSGIVTSDGSCLHGYKSLGLVNEVFSDEILGRLEGDAAIGHNRYSTTGSTRACNVQPLVVELKGQQIAIAHNGNLVNALSLRAEMEAAGSIFQSTMDSEIIVHLMAKSGKDSVEDMLKEALARVHGAYSLLMLTLDKLIAVRDPSGFRPLCIGKKDSSFYFASESCGLDTVQADFIRDVLPGEMVVAAGGGFESHRFAFDGRPAYCVFELIYFSRPDSKVFGVSVDAVRKELGKRLAREHPAEADLVMSVPDSSNAAALGYSMESGLQLELGLIRNHYVGRTFIYPTSELRHNRVRIKFNPVRELLQDKRIVVVDDSIVRGTTSKRLMEMLRAAGAREIHLRISSPPIKDPCFYGIDTPRRDDLIAASKSVEEIREYLGVDSLGYLSVDGLLESTGLPKGNFCAACFTGDYPVGFESAPDKHAFEQFDDWALREEK